MLLVLERKKENLRKVEFNLKISDEHTHLSYMRVPPPISPCQKKNWLFSAVKDRPANDLSLIGSKQLVTKYRSFHNRFVLYFVRTSERHRMSLQQRVLRTGVRSSRFLFQIPG